MWPLLLGTTALGLYKGHKQAQREQEIEDQTRRQRAAEIRYSPWTGMTPQTQIRQAGDPFGTMLGSGLQGAGSGFMLGQAYGNMGNKPPMEEEQPGIAQGGGRYGQRAQAGW